LVLLYVVPLGLLVAAAFSHPDIVGHPVFGAWTRSNFDAVFSSMYGRVLWRTLWVSALTSVACLIVGYCVAYTISTYGGRFKTLLVAAVLLPWLVDYLIRIYAWLQLLSDDGPFVRLAHQLNVLPEHTSLLGTQTAVIIGLVYNFLPFAVLPIFTALEGIDRSQIEAARDLFATPSGAFRFVVLPATLAGCVSAFMIVFLLTFGDFATAQVLGGPGQIMLGQVIQDEFTGVGLLPAGAATTCQVLVVVILLLGGLSWASSRLERRFGS